METSDGGTFNSGHSELARAVADSSAVNTSSMSARRSGTVDRDARTQWHDHEQDLASRWHRQTADFTSASEMRGDELAQGDVADQRLTHLPAERSHAETTHSARCDVSPPSTGETRVDGTSAAAAYVAKRQQRQSDDDVWTTDVSVQTTTYDYLRLVATTDNEQLRRQIDLTMQSQADVEQAIDCCSLYVPMCSLLSLYTLTQNIIIL